MGDAARRLRARAADRRTHRLGAERRLARRLPERAGGPRGAAPHRRRARRRSRCGWWTGPTRRARASGAACSARRRARRLDGRSESCASADATESRCRRAGERTASILRRVEARRAAQERRRVSRAAYRAGAGAGEWICRWASVLGTFGVERHPVTFRGQAAHAGIDADGQAPRRAGRRGEAGARSCARSPSQPATARSAPWAASSREPGIVTSVVETAECTARSASPRRRKLAKMLEQTPKRQRTLREGGGDRGRVGADLEIEPHPVPPRADRAVRRIDHRSRRQVAPPAQRPAARCGRGRARRACRP